MKNSTLKIALVLMPVLFIGCNRTDFSNPDEVIRNYRKLGWENKNETIYNEFLSSKSKELVTKDEFLKEKHLSDSLLKAKKSVDFKITSIPVEGNSSTFKRYRVVDIIKYKNDSSNSTLNYYTLINENGKWKVIWTGTLSDFAYNKLNDANYSEARKTYEKIIEIDPYSGYAYDRLAWSYLYDGSLSKTVLEDGVVKNVKYAMSLEEDNPDHYNTMGSYFNERGNYDLAVENLKHGAGYCLNNSDKAKFYANISATYLTLKSFDSAENYIKKSLLIDSQFTYAWFKYGEIMLFQNNISKAAEYYKKAIAMPKVSNRVQKVLYFEYSYCCLNTNNCDLANKYIMKAIDIEPNNTNYQNLYEQIKNCVNK